MKAIDVNKRCCTCKHETDKCVKMTTEQGLDICFDTNVVDVEGETKEVITALVKENRRQERCLKFALWMFVVIAVLSLIRIFI